MSTQSHQADRAIIDKVANGWVVLFQQSFIDVETYTVRSFEELDAVFKKHISFPSTEPNK